MLVCLDLCFMPSSMCLCAPCHACVPRPRLVCHAMCYYSRFVYFIAFSCHCPYNLAHIKGFGSPIFHVYTWLLLCFMLVSASLVLGFVTFGALSGFMVVWLHSTPMRPCLDVAIWDALPWCRLLRARLSPFSLCLPSFFCATRWLYVHLYTFVYMFMHESFLLVSSMLQHNEAMDIWSKPTFVPREHHLLFAILLVYPLLVVCYLACLPICSCVCSHPICYACHCYLACSFCALLLLSMHLSLSIARLLISCLCLCMYTHGARIHGTRAQSPRRKQKGRGCKLANMSRAVVFNRFRV